MRITIKNLKKIISEAVDDGTTMIIDTRENLEQQISAMQPDDVALSDYVDADTGEIYLQRGEKARLSQLHPQSDIDWQEKRATSQHDEDLEDDASLIDVIRDNFDSAVKEFAQNWTNFADEHGGDEDFSTMAHDAALGFFHEYPKWNDWALELGMSRRDVLDYVAEAVHEAMVTGSV